MSGLVYALVIFVLGSAALGCLVVAAGQGWTAVGVLALLGALAAVAVLISYASTTRRRQRPPMP